MKKFAILLWEGLKLFFILPFAMTSKRIFESCGTTYYIEPMPKNVFNLCVQWLLSQGRRLGFSYEDINVLIFCIVWPAITILSLLLNAILLIAVFRHA